MLYSHVFSVSVSYAIRDFFVAFVGFPPDQAASVLSITVLWQWKKQLSQYWLLKPSLKSDMCHFYSHCND